MKSSRTSSRRDLPRRSPPAGFTLVELLVVIGIMTILVVMTIGMVNVTQDEDRVREGAAQVRSFLEGARDRAIHAKEPRGVRFVLDTKQDPSDPDTASSMLYIGPPENFSERSIMVNAADGITIDFRLDPKLKPQWENLVDRGLLPDTGSSGQTAVLRIGQNQSLYTIQITGASGSRVFQLTKPYAGTTGIPEEYSLQLNPAVLPNQEPRTLPRDVVIDLDHSQLPVSWGGTKNHIANLDVLFSPHGTVTGLVASAGVINLVVAEGVDVFQNRLPGDITKEGNERVVSLRTQTGGISVHNVDPTDSDGMNGADDPFKYAANGEPAK